MFRSIKQRLGLRGRERKVLLSLLSLFAGEAALAGGGKRGHFPRLQRVLLSLLIPEVTRSDMLRSLASPFRRCLLSSYSHLAAKRRYYKLENDARVLRSSPQNYHHPNTQFKGIDPLKMVSPTRHSVTPKSRVVVLGAGNFGSCLADHLADSDHDVQLWSRSEGFVKYFNEHHKNPDYLKEHSFPECITAVGPELPSAEDIKNVDVLLFAIPTEGPR